jgi:hypothetical protein
VNIAGKTHRLVDVPAGIVQTPNCQLIFAADGVVDHCRRFIVALVIALPRHIVAANKQQTACGGWVLVHSFCMYKNLRLK